MAAPDAQGMVAELYPLTDQGYNGEDPVTAGDPDHAEEPTVVDKGVYVGKAHVEQMAALREEFGEDVLKCVRKLHHGMGHPSSSF